MAPPVWMDNLIAYSLQIAILASAGTLLAYLFQLRVPRVSFIYWQILLLVCLLLPALQNWKHPVQFQALAISNTVVYEIPKGIVAGKAKPSFSITPKAIGMAIGAGACLRMIWLAFGYFRLRRFLRRSQLLSATPAVGESISSHIRVQARFFLSNEIDSPATFGLITPTVILPGAFAAMSEVCREAIVCHELLHVRRRDWAVILVEEIICSIYWFHPAVWWLLGRIHLTREQSVDHEVVQLTGSRQPYLDSLLEIARSRGRPKAVSAPLFLRERHLVQRVALLLKEVSMNRLRLVVSLAGMAVLLAGTVRLAAGWFPLTGQPEVVRQQSANIVQGPIKVGGDSMESALISKVEPIYPEMALKARLSGKVILTVTVNEQGFVSDVQVSMGHPSLSKAAVAAVRQWQYRPTLLNGVPVPVTTTATVVFALKGDKAEVGSGLDAPPMPPMKPMGSLNHIAVGRDWFILSKAAPIDEKGSPSPNMQDFRAPEVAMTPEGSLLWLKMVEAGWPADMAKGTPISYSFVINESGELTNFTRVQGPEIPDLERQVSQLRVVSPGLLGSTLVRSSCVIEIRVGLSMDEIQGLIQSNAPTGK